MNTGNKAVFYLTDNGMKLAVRLKGLYPGINIIKYSDRAVRDFWGTDKSLIFIMAAGIVVRTIAPLVKDKRTDPGVVMMDEKGQFITSLLSGHLGGANKLATDIARFLGGKAIISTASDVNNMPSLDLWAQGQGLVIEEWGLLPHAGTRLLNNGALKVYTEIPVELPDVFYMVDDPGIADVCITNKKSVYNSDPGSIKKQIYLRPKNLVVGIGCNSGTAASEIKDMVIKVFDEHNLSPLSIRVLATIDLKVGEPGLKEFAAKTGIKIITFTPDELNGVQGIGKSETVFKATGAYAVSEAAALLASGAGSLIVQKQKAGNVTLAIAEDMPGAVNCCGNAAGKIYIVGTGPGSLEHITPYAGESIRKSEVVVGYGTYLDLITDLIKDKEVVSTGMTQEIDRCRTAVELALSGKTVAVVSGGDPGIYAMAGLVFELLKRSVPEAPSQRVPIEVEVIPGISAVNAAASRLGAPLMHDFAVISLSDRLTPWELIEKRLEAAAMADFVIVLYNPKSMGRPEHIDKARAVCLRHRNAETPVGIVRAAMRENEKVIITDLKHMLNHDIDMQTTVIIGNSTTFTWNNLIITPRGYTA